MANEEVLGPRKTMFVLVIVVGCFAVLWPRILSPLVMGPSREQLKPNQFDREAGCCEVIFEKDMAIIELLNEVCSTTTHADNSPYTVAECRKAVNDTCGVDIAAFLKRSDNVGKTSKILIETMRNSNSSCLREHFGVPVWSLGPHLIQNSWSQQDTTLKQERSPIRGAGPHPALRERGRAIPPGAPAPQTRGAVSMPPHARVRSSPLSVYFELDIKPPPIPGMRPPLGSPGGPVPTPKSSMGFVMPIYTICIIVFFVYTLSKILFKRTGTTYEPITPDPQFRRRVFREDSRTTPDKLGPKERDTRDVELEALRARLAETERAMQRIVSQLAQRDADVQQDNHTRPYTNGTILHNSGPVHIVASEYHEPAKEAEPQKEKELSSVPDIETDKDLEQREPTPELEVKDYAEESTESKESLPELLDREITPEKAIEDHQEIREPSPGPKESTPELQEQKESILESKEPTPEPKEPTPESKEATLESKEITPDNKTDTKDEEEQEIEDEVVEEEDEEIEPIKVNGKSELIESQTDELKSDIKVEKNGDIRKTEEFLQEEIDAVIEEEEKQSTPELLEEAIKDEEEDNEKSSVKVVGMEVTTHQADGGRAPPHRPPASPVPPPHAALAPLPRAHEAASVKSIFLETEIPQQSRVLVADFVEDRADKPLPTKHSPMVVSGKMTLSLIQDAPRETPERDQESTVDDFTTASAVTQDAAEKEGEQSDEEIEEEIEIEEIEEEVEEEEEEEEEQKLKEPSKQ